MAMVDTSGAGDDPPPPPYKRFSFGKWTFHYCIVKKNNKNSDLHTEGEQRRKKGIKLLACLKPRTLDDDSTQEVGGRIIMEVPAISGNLVERTHQSLLERGGLDVNELRALRFDPEGLVAGAMNANGGMHQSESSTQDAQHSTSSIQADQHGEGLAQAHYPFSFPLPLTQPPSPIPAHRFGTFHQHSHDSTQPPSSIPTHPSETFHQHDQGSAQSHSAASASESVGHGQSSTQSHGLRCEVDGCLNFRGSCPQHDEDVFLTCKIQLRGRVRGWGFS